MKALIVFLLHLVLLFGLVFLDKKFVSVVTVTTKCKEQECDHGDYKA